MEPIDIINRELIAAQERADALENELAKQHLLGPELAGALAKAQGEVRHALKSAENKFIGSQYADLGMVVDAAREPLAKNGLSVSQVTRTDARAGVILQTSVDPQRDPDPADAAAQGRQGLGG
jgi:hypothetical protein